MDNSFDVFDVFNIFSNGLNISSGIENVCITTVGTDGTWSGYKKDSYGEITPNATLNGIKIYQYAWKNTGEFILSFGDGTEHLTNINKILMAHPSIPEAAVAVWNNTTTNYEFTDIDLYNGINGTEPCFFVEMVPDKLVKLSFTTLYTGTK